MAENGDVLTPRSARNTQGHEVAVILWLGERYNRESKSPVIDVGCHGALSMIGTTGSAGIAMVILH